MDDVRFDQVARSLRGVAPRRGALGLLMGGALGLTGLAGSDAKKKGKGKKKKKKNDVCKKVDQACGDNGGCAFGANCCTDLNCDNCSNAFCLSSDKDTVGICDCLSTHQFLNGRCGEKPECLSAGIARTSQFDIRCCSGIQDMETDICQPGVLSCLTNDDCDSGLCRGFVCAAATLECQNQ